VVVWRGSFCVVLCLPFFFFCFFGCLVFFFFFFCLFFVVFVFLLFVVSFLSAVFFLFFCFCFFAFVFSLFCPDPSPKVANTPSPYFFCSRSCLVFFPFSLDALLPPLKESQRVSQGSLASTHYLFNFSTWILLLMPLVFLPFPKSYLFSPPSNYT